MVHAWIARACYQKTRRANAAESTTDALEPTPTCAKCACVRCARHKNWRGMAFAFPLCTRARA
eukprot:11192458-Lingulodinium_polyedra.AAC.1